MQFPRPLILLVLCATGALFLPTQRTTAADTLTNDLTPQSPVSHQRSEPQPIEIQGKLVCLADVIHENYGTELPAEHHHVLGFKSNDGTLYALIPTRLSDALFHDPKLKTKELLLLGRVFPKSHILDVTRTRSVRDGIVYDLYYYCSVCHIESVSPGPCVCCQGEVELTEKPLTEHASSNKR